MIYLDEVVDVTSDHFREHFRVQRTPKALRDARRKFAESQAENTPR